MGATSIYRHYSKIAASPQDRHIGTSTIVHFVRRGTVTYRIICQWSIVCLTA